MLKFQSLHFLAEFITLQLVLFHVHFQCQVMLKPEEGLFRQSDALLQKPHILEYNTRPLKKFASWNPALAIETTSSRFELSLQTWEFSTSSWPAGWFSSTDFDSGERLLWEV